jgi:hypothetical protein
MTIRPLISAEGWPIRSRRKQAPGLLPPCDLWTTARASLGLCTLGGRRDRIWEHCAELILMAARTGRRADVDAAAAQMERALRCEG